MRRYRPGILAILIVCLLTTCNMFDPQWMGVWVDATTVDQVTVTLDLGKDEGTVTVVNTDPDAETSLTIVEGSLEGDEDTITATITYLYAKRNDSPEPFETDNPAFIEAYMRTLGVARTNSCSYTIEGNTFTIWGPLISVLTENVSDTLTAIK